MIDFDAQFDLHFKNKLCCEYVSPEESVPVLSTQTVLLYRGTRPSMNIRHWEWFTDVGE